MDEEIEIMMEEIPEKNINLIRNDTIESTVSNILEKITETSKLATGESLRFTVFDYSIFTIMLGLSALIGIYFGFISKKKQNNTEEYLLGGKSMSTFPVSASLIAR